MTTPQGPDRYGADRDQGGTPTWGTSPPGGWGDDDAGPPTGAWDGAWDDDERAGHAEPAAYVGRRRAEDREVPSGGAPWGDQADEQAYADRPLGAGRPSGSDPWSDTGETVAVAGDPGVRDDAFAPGDEPWAPREAVKTPWRGPGGLGAGAVAGIGAGVVVVAALLVALFWVPGWAVTSTLDKTALQNGVTQILTQNYKLQVGAVECPDDVTVEAGTEFSCQALIDGEQVTVPGRVTTDEGDYQVDRV